jgi:hypothetical protein
LGGFDSMDFEVAVVLSLLSGNVAVPWRWLAALEDGLTIGLMTDPSVPASFPVA